MSYDITVDGTKMEDLEHTFQASNIVEAVSKAMDDIYDVARLTASDIASIKVDIWDVCEVEE